MGLDHYNSAKLFRSYEDTAQSLTSTRNGSDVPLGIIDQTLYPYNLILCGTIAPKLSLLPAFTVKSPGGYFRETGPYTLIGKDISGNTLFSQHFDQDVYQEAGSEAIPFCFSLPITAPTYANLNSLTLTANRSSTTLTSVAINPPVVTAVSNGSGKIAITWNGGQYPIGDVVGSDIDQYIQANASTGLSTATISSSATSLAIGFSDNVKTTNVTVKVTKQ